MMKPIVALVLLCGCSGGVEVFTDKKTYVLGDTAAITVINHTFEPVETGVCDAGFRRLDDRWLTFGLRPNEACPAIGLQIPALGQKVFQVWLSPDLDLEGETTFVAFHDVIAPIDSAPVTITQ